MSEKLFKILTINSGGIRGVLAAEILDYIEQELIRQTGNSDARLADYFDMIGGTSIGGILAGMLLCPRWEAPDRPKYTANEVANTLAEHGGLVFKSKITQQFKSFFGLISNRNTGKGLENLLVQYLGHTRMSQLLKETLFPSYSPAKKQLHFFHRPNLDAGEPDFMLRDVVKATSAGPTYFPVAKIYSTQGKDFSFIDGGVFAINPAMCALMQMRKRYNLKTENIMLVSVGTGKSRKRYSHEEASNWGILGWITSLYEIFSTSNQDLVNYYLNTEFEIAQSSDQLFLLQPWLLTANFSPDDASRKNIVDLRRDGLTFCRDNAKQISQLVEKLIKE